MFAVWQPGNTKSLNAVNDPGTLCWTELTTPAAQHCRKPAEHDPICEPFEFKSAPRGSDVSTPR